MRARGLDYGPAFRTVAECFMGDGEALGRLHLPAKVGRGHAARISLLDGALQLVVAALPPATGHRTYLPVSAERVEIREPLDGAERWAHARVTTGSDGEYLGTVTVLDGDGRVVAEVRGLHLRPAGRRPADLDDLFYEVRWDDAERRPGLASPAGPWLVFASATVGADLADRLRAEGHRCVVVTAGPCYTRQGCDQFCLPPGEADAYAQLLRDVFLDEHACGGIVYAWPTDVAAGGAGVVESAEELGCAGPVALVQALDATACVEAARIWLVTRGAQSIGDDPVVAPQAVTWGLGRALAAERPEHQCTLVDVDPCGGDDTELFAEIDSGSPDQQVALRAGGRQVARLVRRSPPVAAAATGETDVYRLAATTPGALDSIRPIVAARRPPGPGEVELAVEAAALNFLDVLKAMGVYPGLAPDPSVALGAECAATVVTVGPGVDEFAVGDEVVAITSSYRDTSMLSAYVTLPAAFVASRPAHMTATEASALPVAYLTAYYALHELGRIRRGDTVLIHAAAGGVGLAAIALCRRAGAEVVATAGSLEKRDYLRALGVEHVFDSRSVAFADDVRRCTGGRGVDVVLNSLTGAAIAAGLATLAPRGRFVEIGKRDIYADTHIGLQPFAANLSFFAVDLARMTDEDPAYLAGLFREVMALVAAGELPPLPTTAVAVAEAADSFRTMAQAGHTGKLVVTGWDQPMSVERALVRADATYLVTGGMGALGLAVARHLVAQGARHVTLLGRTAPGVDALAAIAQLGDRGATVSTLLADVGDRRQLADALTHLATSAPPLRGVVHAAGVLADATLATMDRATLHAALLPKVAGAWNLHLLTEDQPLDFFVLFSSVASILGLAGQGNYAAGNAFLDALAHQRRAEGRTALAVNWGPWAAIGLAAAAANRGERLSERGLTSVAAEDAFGALEVLCAGGDVQAAVMPFDAERWAATDPTAVALLGALTDAAATTTTQGSLRSALAVVVSADRRQRLLEDAVCAQLGPVLRLAPERIDRQRPLKALGLDSLMALELRNRLEVEIGSVLPATVAWNYPTVAALAGHLAERMELSLPPVTAEPVTATPDAEAEEWVDLSQQDLEAMLDDELAAIDELLQSEHRP
jgi:NADPH:quinone reductase-like Zn-dependent oxidoreductase/acyl carrier protein